MIKVDSRITITLEDGTLISMSKSEAEQLYSQLACALNKNSNPTNPFYFAPGVRNFDGTNPNTITC